MSSQTEEGTVAEARIAVIGGTNLYEIEGLIEVDEVSIETPFGSPSDRITVGNLEGVPVAFLPRHGKGHRIMPSELPAWANIYALKSLGVEFIVSVSAVGSLSDDVHPMDLVVPDQLIDRTRMRPSTFFGEGIVAHVGFAEPFCPVLSQLLVQTAREVGARVHPQGTYLVMEGPMFSTKAESFLYRGWGAHVIGMTALPEAKLAREAEICYATLACVTDYDCWHETSEVVTIDMVVQNLQRNADTAKRIVRQVVSRMPDHRFCPCASALENSIITAPELIPPEVKERLRPIIDKYVRCEDYAQ